MACTLSESAEQRLLKYSPGMAKQSARDTQAIVLLQRQFMTSQSLYGCPMTVPTLVVPGQTEEMILGTNIIKRLLTQLRETSGYWRLMSMPNHNQSDECSELLSLFSNTKR